MLHYQNLLTLCLLSVLDKHAPKKKKKERKKRKRKIYVQTIGIL